MYCTHSSWNPAPSIDFPSWNNSRRPFTTETTSYQITVCLLCYFSVLFYLHERFRHAIGCFLLFELHSVKLFMDLFRVRLNCVDYYHTTPTEFDPSLPKDDGTSPQKELSKVPVIRVFGATETGQKVCAHIHGAFPYLYIRYEGSLAAEEGKLILF